MKRFCLFLLTAGFLFSCNNNGSRQAAAADDSAAAKKDSAASPAAGFERPQWIRQSNIYEVNVRQYTKEGTFAAFAKSLPRLKAMGVDILWFMPITPISKKDRKGTLGSYYAVQDYKAVNPEFGTMDDWKQLVNKAHAMGFKVITDWVPNHTGADNGWLVRHPDFYVKDSTGKIVSPYDWTDTRKLDYTNPAMRDSMIDAMEFWVTQTNTDGFRCDVAGDVPTGFWRSCIRILRKDKPVFMLAEADKGELHEAGFDATYPWDMFKTMKLIAAGQRDALSIDSVLARQDSSFPAGAIRMYFTSNHDENSWGGSDYATFPGPKHAPFAVFTQTMRNSLPLIYSGQEEPVLRKIEFFEKDPMPFGHYARAPFYKKLLMLRKDNPALATDAAFKKVKAGDEKCVYAYTREKDGHRVLVILNFSPKKQAILLEDEALNGEALNLFKGSREKIKTGKAFNLGPWGYLVYEYK